MNESERTNAQSIGIRDEDLKNSFLKQGDEPAFRLILLAAMKNDSIQTEIFYSWWKGGMKWIVGAVSTVLIVAFVVYVWPIPHVASKFN